MLSNQMRGRALRAFSAMPDKTANIWHLASVDTEAPDAGSDIKTLRRRFDAFLGLHANKDLIESGISRLAVPFDLISQEQLDEFNKRAMASAQDRGNIRSGWERALSGAQFHENADKVILGGSPRMVKTFSGLFPSTSALRRVFAGGKKIWQTARYGTDTAFLIAVFDATHAALEQADKIEGDAQALNVRGVRGETGAVSLVGGWRTDRVTVTEAICDVFQISVDCRYLIVVKFAPFMRYYFAVPRALAANKTTATLFLECWRRIIGRAELVYCGNAEGQKLLAKARAKANATPNQTIERKQVWM